VAPHRPAEPIGTKAAPGPAVAGAKADHSELPRSTPPGR